MQDEKPAIYIGSDHAGFELKKVLFDHLKNHGYDVIDRGAFEYSPSDDYPDFVRIVANDISEDPDNRLGIVIGGSGQGEAVVSNRHKGVRATVYYGGPIDIVTLSRKHNNANVLSLGARFIEEQDAKEVVKIWIETPFSYEERHVRRINKIDNYIYL
jgi:ribose 5-phosphate isomerase B